MMFDVDTHLILAVVVEVLLDVLDGGLFVGEELASGVGVAFVQASYGVDYCI
jgi:hypothetical protein